MNNLPGGPFACPTCGCPKFTDDVHDLGTEPLGVREFRCGFALATWGDRRSPCLSAWRRPVWLARVRRVAWRFVPDGHTTATAAVRVSVGGLVLAAEHLVPEAITSWVHLAGRIFVIMGVWTLIGHAERTFTSHVRVVGERLASQMMGRKIALKARASEGLLP